MAPNNHSSRSASNITSLSCSSPFSAPLSSVLYKATPPTQQQRLGRVIGTKPNFAVSPTNRVANFHSDSDFRFAAARDLDRQVLACCTLTIVGSANQTYRFSRPILDLQSKLNPLARLSRPQFRNDRLGHQVLPRPRWRRISRHRVRKRGRHGHTQ